MVEAQETLRKFLLTPGHVFLADDASYVDVPSKSLQGHRQWTDAYLLSLARKHNLMLASLDSRLSNVDDAANPAFFLLV
jgi:predicted nucleic acid-binding protein